VAHGLATLGGGDGPVHVLHQFAACGLTSHERAG
jgi:hypothetical protein